MLHRFEGLQVPTLLVAGDRDSLAPPTTLLDACQRIPPGSLQIFYFLCDDHFELPAREAGHAATGGSEIARVFS